jgi:hypothetical protein
MLAALPDALSGARPSRSLGGRHEFDWFVGAEQALQLAHSNDWTVVSIKDDWATVF